jgi:hypothetical protein
LVYNTTKGTKESQKKRFASGKIAEFHLRGLRALRGFFLVYNTTKDLAMASPATQYGQEYEPRKTRKKVEASRATQVPGFFSSQVLRTMQRNQTLVVQR